MLHRNPVAQHPMPLPPRYECHVLAGTIRRRCDGTLKSVEYQHIMSIKAVTSLFYFMCPVVQG
jgi:hypothetical protein